jgi:hypothetical protein
MFLMDDLKPKKELICNGFPLIKTRLVLLIRVLMEVLGISSLLSSEIIPKSAERISSHWNFLWNEMLIDGAIDLSEFLMAMVIHF